jgi:lipopolysaccharide export system permease protein
MKLLDRYLGARVLRTFFKVTLALILIFVLVDLLTTRKNQIMRFDVPWNIILAYYTVSIPQILYKYQIGALGMLVAALLVLGDAAQNREVTAALAGGVSLRRLVRAPVLVAAGLAFAMFFMQNTVGVSASRKMDDLNDRYFSQNAQTKRDGISWANLGGRWTCHIMKFNRMALTGEDVLIHSRGQGKVEQIDARRIFWDPAKRQWILEGGRWAKADPDSDWDIVVSRITQQPAPFNEPPEQLFALEDSPDTKSAGQLLGDIRRGEKQGVPVNGAWSDFYAKFSQPALCFIMIWLAIPFAMRLRRGGLAIGFGVSVAIGLAYLIVFQVSMALGHLDRVNPIVAAWFANMVFLAAGLVLFQKTRT